MIPDYTQIVHLDFETFYDNKSGYTLTKMPTIDYCRDERFEFMGCAVSVDDGPHFYIHTRDEFVEWASSIDWSTTAVNAFNCAFDGTVLTQQFGIYPAYYICTKSVAKALLPLERHNLKTVAPALGLGEKGDALKSGSREVTQELADYACNDNVLSYGIYKTLYPMISKAEQDLIHLTVRGWCEPTLELDVEVLTRVRDKAIAEREAAIAASGLDEAVLTSNQQFAAALRSMGLTPPTKLSEATGEETEAFSKGDDEFVSFMLEYPQHQAIWDGRLAAKSNINVRRAEKFLGVARLGTTTPMPLNYCGAHTGRWSGGDSMNVQNLPNLYKSDMRLAFRAPAGQKVVVVDSSQIELRISAWFCGQESILETLRAGGDVYRNEASNQFNIPPEEVVKGQRNFGKAVTLGCGYGMGAPKFRKYCAAGPLGLDPIYLSPSESFSAIQKYRNNNPMIPAMWRTLDHFLHVMSLPGACEQLGPVTFMHNMAVLPSGRCLLYPNLRQSDSGSWVYGGEGKKASFIWGGTLLENLIQALARDVVAYQMLKIEERFRIVSSTHDEAIYLAAAEEAEAALQYGLAVFSESPDWMADCPLGAEGGFDDMYSK